MSDKKRIITVIVICIFIIVSLLVYKAQKSKDFSNIKTYFVNQQKIFSQKLQMPLTEADKYSANNAKSKENKKYDTQLEYGALPYSLRDTKIDGELLADANGKLVVNRGVRHVFDYFLSAVSEESLDNIKGRIEEYINKKLPLDASKEAFEILNSYLEYQKSLTKFEPESTEKQGYIAELKKSINARMELRRKYMKGNVVDVFFSDEEAYDSYTLQRLEIENNESLNQDEKDSKIKDIEEHLPGEYRERHRHIREEASVQKEIDKLMKQGGNSQKIYELRDQFYGKDAADKLDEIDKKRDEFNKRIEDYRKAKDNIFAASLSEDEKQSKIKELENEKFNEQERAELEIIERIRSNKPKQK